LAVLLCSDDKGCFEQEATEKACNNPDYSKFYQERGEAILKVIGKKPLVITPHVIAEASNNLGRGFSLEEVLDKDRRIIRDMLLSSDEKHTSLRELFEQKTFDEHKDLGIADCGLLVVTKQTDLLLTHDGKLKDRANKMGIKAMFPWELYFFIIGQA
jgi:predicted nucleic acid-binding protein